jgi:hypothetical protein
MKTAAFAGGTCGADHSSRLVRDVALPRLRPREMFDAGAVKVRHRRHETACILRTVHTTSEYRISEGLHINEDSYGRVNAVGDQSIMFRLAKGCSLW